MAVLKTSSWRLGATTFTPPRQAGDPGVQALTATFAHGDGTAVLHETIQYLAERSEHEQKWLTALAGAPFPVTMIWGLCDTVSPPRVASLVDTSRERLPAAADLLRAPQPADPD